MGLFFTRKKQEALVKEITQAAVTAAIAAVQEQLSRPSHPSLDEAGGFYGKAIDSMGNFLANAGELALRGAASAMGQRGGRATARNRAAKRVPPTARPVVECELCRNPLTRNVTVESIMRHRQHEYSGPPSPTDTPEGPGTDSGPETPTNNGSNGVVH